jgi:hypothetical protein
VALAVDTAAVLAAIVAAVVSTAAAVAASMVEEAAASTVVAAVTAAVDTGKVRLNARNKKPALLRQAGFFYTLRVDKSSWSRRCG